MDQALTEQFSLEGRTAVVTGAASGIGRQAAVTFAQAGARLVLADIDEAGLAVTAEAVAASRPPLIVQPLDVRDRAAVLALGEAAGGEGPVEVWANVAGVMSRSAVVDTSPEELERVLSVNLKGVFWGCAAAGKAMAAQGRGSIINISSAGGERASPGLSAYSMSKAAVIMLTRTLAHELGPSGVRVNAIAPGFIDTPMISYSFKDADGGIDPRRRAEVFAARASISVLGRTGEPADVALAMLYLAADASRFMTGQVLRPNGGAVML